MTISEKGGFKKNQCIHLATLAASLALGHASDVNSSIAETYSPAKARFFSAENCVYSVDCEIKKEFLSPGASSA